MSKLTKYNQKVIAILGTLSIVAFSLILLIWAYETVGDQLNQYSSSNVNSGLTLDTLRNDSEEILRDQEITFKTPYLVDTIKQTYVIPVATVNLEEPEPVRTLTGFFDNSSKLNVQGPYSSGYNINNLIVYEHTRGEKHVLFNQKTNIQNYRGVEIKNKFYLFVIATQTDTNHDQKLNNSDLQSFFIYDIKMKKLYQLQIENMDADRYERLYETNDLLLYFTVDKNHNGESDYQKEPEYMKIISLDDFVMKDFLAESMIKQLQTIVD